jgi:hypothetical protein
LHRSMILINCGATSASPVEVKELLTAENAEKRRRDRRGRQIFGL